MSVIGNAILLGGGIDTSDANATANDILSGKTAYVNDNKITGNIPTKTSADLTISDGAVAVPSGYYAENANIQVAYVSGTTGYIAEGVVIPNA